MNRCMYILGLHTWISAERQREGFLGIIFSPERGGKKHPSTEFTGNKKKKRKENSPTSHLTKPQAEQKLRRTLHPFPRKTVKKDFSLLSYHLMFPSSVSSIRGKVKSMMPPRVRVFFHSTVSNCCGAPTRDRRIYMQEKSPEIISKCCKDGRSMYVCMYVCRWWTMGDG